MAEGILCNCLETTSIGYNPSTHVVVTPFHKTTMIGFVTWPPFCPRDKPNHSCKIPCELSCIIQV